MKAVALIETDLGTERRCNGCGEFWPLDGEFFHRHPKGIGGYLGTCRACFQERRQGRERTRRRVNRDRARALLGNGLGLAVVADLLHCSPRTLRRLGQSA